MKRFSAILFIPFIMSCSSDKRFEAKGDQFFLKEQLQEMEELIAKGNLRDTAVSQAAIEWHLDHMLKTINNIYDSMDYSNPKQFESSFNFTKTLVFTTGTIPRGAAQSPASVRPPEIILDEDIRKQIELARVKMKAALMLDEDAYFNHPVFNQLNRNEALRFVEIHTNHHLKIIRDILKESAS